MALRELLWLAAAAVPAFFLPAAAANDGFPAIPMQEHDVGCVHMPIFHRTREQQQQPARRRAVQVPFEERYDVGYYTRLSFGTPPQEALVHLDTGSFELWINPDCGVLAASEQPFCQAGGRYNPGQSTTAKPLGTNNTLRYGIGAANITYVRDTIGIPGTNMRVNNTQFGIATSSEQQNAGILGIGHGLGQTITYRNFVDELKAQNVTRTKTFSVALGGKDEKQGVVVFGGVDTAKFSGRLARLPIIPAASSPDGVRRYWVQMQSLTLNPPSRRAKTYDGSRMPVFLDSGSTLTLLPDAMVRAIASDFGSTAQDPQGYWPVSCDLLNLNGTLDFAFSNVTIRVPYREMIRSFGGSCVLGMTSNANFMLLGDTFMRSAYVVFDQESDSIWMTQYANCGNSPAALQSVDSLRTLEGKCTGLTGSSLAGNSAATTLSPSGGGSGNSGGGSGAGPMGPMGPTTTITAPAAGSTNTGNPSSSRGSPSSAPRLAGSMAMAVALPLCVSLAALALPALFPI